MYISKEKLNAACQAAADTLGIDSEIFKRAVYEMKQEEYDRSDIINWLDEQCYVYTDEDVDKILSTLRDDWDADRGTWSNIESAYYNNNMHLPCGDYIPESNDDEEPSECQVTFPNCQKCAHAGECEAYQHALQMMSELPDDSELAKLFMHDTDDCESFEPTEEE